MREPDLYVEWKRRAHSPWFFVFAIAGAVPTIVYFWGFVTYDDYRPPIFQYVVTPAVAAVLLGLAGWRWFASKISTDGAAVARCRQCGYDRRGHDDVAVCPECGRTPSPHGDEDIPVRRDVKSLLAYALPGIVLIVLAILQGGMALLTFWGLSVGAFE